MNSGCICCSLVGDFGKALEKVLDEFAPDRVFIEPSGVGKLSDVMRAAQNACGDKAELGSLVTVVDANKAKIYIKNFGEFFLDQLENAGTVVLSRTDGLDQSKLSRAVELIREHNETATVVTTPWDMLTGDQLRDAIENKNTLASALEKFEHEATCRHHHHNHDGECNCEECHAHDHHDHECDCDCEECRSHHHHHNGQDPSVHAPHEHSHEHECNCHDHHTHAHDEHHHEEDSGVHAPHEHSHEHDHDCHEHHTHAHDDHHNGQDSGVHASHEHSHDADEVFTSCGIETSHRYTYEELDEILAFFDEAVYGVVLRAKGIVAGADGSWFHFDYVPGERNIRRGAPEVTGRICVIGSGIDKESVREIFLA